MQQELWARDQRVPGDWTHLSSRPGPWGLPGAVVGIRGRRGDTGGDKGGPRWRQGVTGGTQGGHRVPWELWSARGVTLARLSFPQLLRKTLQKAKMERVLVTLLPRVYWLGI